MGCSDCTPVDVERWRPPFDEGGSLPAVYDSLWRVHRIPRSPPMRRARVSAMGIVESHVEEAMLAWLGELGYEVAYGPDVEPEKLAAERDDFTEVVPLGVSRQRCGGSTRACWPRPSTMRSRRRSSPRAPASLRTTIAFTACWSTASTWSTRGRTARSPATRPGSSTSTTLTPTTGSP